MTNPLSDLPATDENLIDGYKAAASGAQKLAEAIDCLLPTLIEIAAASAKNASVKALRDAAESALLQFEDVSGQKLNRGRYMASKKRLDAVAEGAALHAARHG